MRLLRSFKLCACAGFATLLIGGTNALSDALDAHPTIREEIEKKQEELDPGCKRASFERERSLPASLGMLTKQLCAMQTDGKPCFYEGVSVEKYLEKIRPLTRCESVLSLSILELNNAELAPALKEREGLVPELQPIATWGFPSFGSFVLPISEAQNQYVIVFNRATFSALLDLMKSLTAIIPIDDHPGNIAVSFDAGRIAKALDAHPDVLGRVSIQLANLVANRGNDIDVPTLPLNTNQLLLVTRSLKAVELFMLAHEYGHQHHKHYAATSNDSASARYAGFTVAQEKEIDADIYGQELLILMAEKEFSDNPISALVYRSGGELFLAIEELLGNARKSVGVELPQQPTTYPQPRERLSFIVEAQQKQRAKYPRLFQAELGVPYRIAAEVLWKRIEDRFPVVYRALNEIKGKR